MTTVRPESISDEQIAKADIIVALDPKTQAETRLWGQESLPNVAAPGTPAHRIEVLEIELAESDHRGLLDLIHRVEAIRGHLPRDIQKLRVRLLAEPTSRPWEPIEELPDNWQQTLKNSQTLSIVEAWHEQTQDLREQDLYKDFLEELRREWAIETGVIEGLYTLSEGATTTLIEKGLDAALISHEDTNDSPDNVIAKIQDQYQAIKGVEQFLTGTRALGTSYIKELHRVLTAHQATYTARDTLGNFVPRELPKGKWKELGNSVEHPDGTKFEYCPPEHVAQEMDHLIDMYRSHESLAIPPDVEAAWLHHRFSLIHPFTDGNGRVARCLATLVLLKANWLPLVITRKERDAYIMALRSADLGYLKPLVDLFGSLQRKAIREANSLREEVVKKATAIEGILFAVTEKLEERRAHKSKAVERALDTADSLHVITKQQLEGLESQISSSIGPTYRVRVTDAKRGDEKAKFYYHQIIECAKKLDYFANLGIYQAWAALVIDTDRKAEILFSFHGIGHSDRGVLGCSAMFYTKERTDDENTVVTNLTPLTDEPFEFGYTEDATQVRQRFRNWLGESILQGLEHWKNLV